MDVLDQSLVEVDLARAGLGVDIRRDLAEHTEVLEDVVRRGEAIHPLPLGLGERRGLA